MTRAIIVGGLEVVPLEKLDRQVDCADPCKVIDVDSTESAARQVDECLVALGLKPEDYAYIDGTCAWVHRDVSEERIVDLKEALMETVNRAQESAEAAVKAALVLGVQQVIVMTAILDAKGNSAWYVAYAGGGLAVRGLAELGVESVRRTTAVTGGKESNGEEQKA